MHDHEYIHTHTGDAILASEAIDTGCVVRTVCGIDCRSVFLSESNFMFKARVKMEIFVSLFVGGGVI